jgi:probable HAF family extracellular repeat protein
MSPLGQNSAANGINNSGQVVGTFQFTFPDGPIHAALWSPTGQVQDLGALPGGDFSEGMKINDAGTVIGVSTSSGASILRGFSWTPGQGMIDLNPDGLGFTPGGINQSGTIVGSLGANSNMAGIASIVTGAVIQDLNGLILPGYNVSLSNGCAINDSGQIVVTGTVDFVTGAFLLTPVVIQPRKQRPATCEPLLQKFIMWNADLTQRIQDLQNLGTPQREIPNDPTVKTLSNDIAKLSTEMTAVGCPPPLLVRVAPLADSNP